MEVIGKYEGGFILKASNDEISKIIGYYGTYSSGYAEPKIGSNIEINAMFAQLYELARSKKRVKEAQQVLRDTADTLERVIPVTEIVKDGGK